jgi:hypothetical protein
MKVFFPAITLLAAAALPLMARPRQDQPVGAPPPVAVVLDGVELQDATPDRIRFNVKSHITADRKLSIKRVVFEQMRLEGVPVYLRPIEEHLELEKSAPVALPKIPLTIYFRDLDSLQPIEQAVREGNVSMSGKAHVDVDLNMIERVLSRQSSARADLPIAVTAPIEVPGGATGKTAALLTLRAAEVAMSFGGSALSGLRKSQKDWELELRTKYIPGLVVVESRYSVRLSDGQRTEFVVHGLGFRITEDKFVVPDELVEPWNYDADVAMTVQSGKASLLEEGRELRVWPSGEAPNYASARSLSNGAVRMEFKSSKTDIARIPEGKKNIKVRILQRGSDDNFAILRFTRPSDKGAAITIAPDSVKTAQDWARLTLFRADEDGKLELVSTPAHRDQARIALDDSIDDRAFGSLLIAPEGAVGMVQEENGGMILRSEW